MAKKVVVSATRDLRRVIGALESRRRSLLQELTPEPEWRRLQFDSVSALVECKRTSIALHRRVVETLRSDAVVSRRVRMEVHELASLLEEMKVLVKQIEQDLLSLPSQIN